MNEKNIFHINSDLDSALKDLDYLDDQLRKAKVALKTACKYYERMEFIKCCSGEQCACKGLPIDPEWHLFNLFKETLEFLERDDLA